MFVLIAVGALAIGLIGGLAMSQKYRHQFVDALGGIQFDAVGNRRQAAGAGAPTASIAGYNTGCLYQREDGVAGTSLYVNTGTNASSTWVAIA